MRSFQAITPPLSLDFVLPFARIDTLFSETLLAELENLKPHFAQIGADVSPHCIDHVEPARFADQLLDLADSTDGIAFTAPEHPSVKNAINRLSEKGVGCVSLISDISGTSRIGFSGMDNRSAGRTAALLMGRFLKHRDSGVLALLTGRHHYRANEEREAGFKSMIKERFPGLTTLVIPEMRDDNVLSRELTLELLEQRPDIVGIYNEFSGGSLGIVDALKSLRRVSDVVLIAHELNSATRHCLIDGSIDVIIGQALRHQIYNAVEMLVHHKHERPITAGIVQPQAQIYMAENIV